MVDINYAISKNIWCITFATRSAVGAALQTNKSFFINNSVFKYEPIKTAYPLKGTIYPPKHYSGPFEKDPDKPKYF